MRSPQSRSTTYRRHRFPSLKVEPNWTNLFMGTPLSGFGKWTYRLVESRWLFSASSYSRPSSVTYRLTLPTPCGWD